MQWLVLLIMLGSALYRFVKKAREAKRKRLNGFDFEALMEALGLEKIDKEQEGEEEDPSASLRMTGYKEAADEGFEQTVVVMEGGYEPIEPFEGMEPVDHDHGERRPWEDLEPHDEGGGLVDAAAMRRAVIMAELLAKPVSLRRGGRRAG